MAEVAKVPTRDLLVPAPREAVTPRGLIIGHLAQNDDINQPIEVVDKDGLVWFVRSTGSSFVWGREWEPGLHRLRLSLDREHGGQLDHNGIQRRHPSDR